MTTIRWKLPSPNTQRVYARAVQDFESVVGVPAVEANAKTLAEWESSMRKRLSVNTIRTYLSAVSSTSGVRVLLPKRQAAEQRLLSQEQVRELMSGVRDQADRMTLAKTFTLGSKAVGAVWSDSDFLAHVIGAESRKPGSAQRISRMIKRHARRANLDPMQVNLRVWVMSGRQLARSMDPLELAELLHARTQDAGLTVDRKWLHGINRRSRSLKA